MYLVCRYSTIDVDGDGGGDVVNLDAVDQYLEVGDGGEVRKMECVTMDVVGDPMILDAVDNDMTEAGFKVERYMSFYLSKKTC